MTAQPPASIRRNPAPVAAAGNPASRPAPTPRPTVAYNPPPPPDFPVEAEYMSPIDDMPAETAPVNPAVKPASPTGPRTWTDAPATMFTPLYVASKNDPNQVTQLNLTLKADSYKEVIDAMVAAIAYAGQAYGMTTDRPGVNFAAAPAPAPVASPAPVPPSAVAPTAPGAAPAPAASNGQAPMAPAVAPSTAAANARQASAPGSQIIRAVRMEVEPRPDGRIKLKWMEAGHMFKDIDKVCTVETAIEILAPTGNWQASHFAKATVYNDVNMLIYWRPSANTTTKGNPYKDIVTIAPAA